MTDTWIAAYYIDFGRDFGIAEDVITVMSKMELGFRMTGSRKLVLSDGAVEFLRKQPEDANGGISDDEDGVPCMWIHGYAYPVMPAF
jgi:hypothetical protein